MDLVGAAIGTFILGCFALGAVFVASACSEGGMPRFATAFYALALFYLLLAALPWL